MAGHFFCFLIYDAPGSFLPPFLPFFFGVFPDAEGGGRHKAIQAWNNTQRPPHPQWDGGKKKRRLGKVSTQTARVLIGWVLFPSSG